MVTVSQLRDWRPEALAATADALWRQANEMDALAQRLGSVTGPRLYAAWDGSAATEARAHGARRQAQLAAFADQVAAGGMALEAAATAIAEAKAMLARAAEVIAGADLRMDESGIVTVPPDRLPAALDPADIAAIRANQQEDIRQATILAQAALAAADEADRDAARAISSLPALTGMVTGAGMAIGPLLTGEPLRALLLAGLLQGITLRDLPPPGATPQQVAMWWAGLSPEQRQLQIRANPGAIGSLDGLPASARHAANLLVLARSRTTANAGVARRQADLDRARADAATDPPRHAGRTGITPTQVRLATLQARLDEAVRHRDMLAAVQAQLDADPGGRTLLLLDPAGEGRAAIALGPIDTARHVAVIVPGLEQDVREDLDNIVSNAERLRLTGDRLTSKVTGGDSVATVAWIGYDTPSYVQVTIDGKAERGAVHLRDTLAGLDAAREGARLMASAGGGPEPLHLTVVGHSYGSLATGIAVRDATPVDEVAFIGSPGVGANHVSQLDVPQGHVFVGENRGDPIADLQRFGTDPNDDRFGAREFETDGGTDPLTGAVLTDSHGHSEHFDLGTESVRNLALITLGRDDLVSYGEMGSFGDGFVDWLLGRGLR